MNEFLKRLIVGGLGGFVSAALVDLSAWSRSSGSASLGGDSEGEVAAFDWGLAVRRWVSGAVSGAMTAGGFTAVIP
jgi:hypothetical protein